MSPFFTERVKTAQSDGLIVSCAELDKHQGSNLYECWQPTESEVKLFENGLKSFVEGQPGGRTSRVYRELARYKRHYEGMVINGRRVLVASFYHISSTLVTEKDWERTPVGVCGGGDNYFTVKFDAEKKLYYDFWVNADA